MSPKTYPRPPNSCRQAALPFPLFFRVFFPPGEILKSGVGIRFRAPIIDASLLIACYIYIYTHYNILIQYSTIVLCTTMILILYTTNSGARTGLSAYR